MQPGGVNGERDERSRQHEEVLHPVIESGDSKVTSDRWPSRSAGREGRTGDGVAPDGYVVEPGKGVLLGPETANVNEGQDSLIRARR